MIIKKDFRNNLGGRGYVYDTIVELYAGHRTLRIKTTSYTIEVTYKSDELLRYELQHIESLISTPDIIEYEEFVKILERNALGVV